MENFAPVLIPTLNRHMHLKRCIESLSICTHANKTDLFIALDYPTKDSQIEGYEIIKAYLPKISGFNSVNIVARGENYGAFKNISECRRDIYKRFDRLIVSEDDNVFSPNFLDFINKGLEKFKNDKNILAVCGYNFPINIKLCTNENFYINKAFSAWGYATWRDRNLKLVYSKEEIVGLIRNRRFVQSSYNYYGFSRIAKLFEAYKSDMYIYGDRAITTTLINEDKFCVFPSISKVRNFGHDGSGIHCNLIEENIFDNQLIDNNVEFLYGGSGSLSSECILKETRKYFGMKLGSKVRFIINYGLFLLKKK